MGLTDLSLKEIRDQVLSKKVSALEVTKAFLDRSKKLNPKINAYITICESEALAQATKIDQKIAKKESVGSLAGVPVAVKDLLLTKGIRTTAGSKILENFVAPYNATVVEKLESQDAVIIAKANLDEFAMGASNENSAFGPVKNPWDLTRVPGGSSGGSAAAIPAGMAAGTIGTDTGGSIREPASFSGIVGIKPTYGRVSRFGVVAFASSLDQVGPMTATVEDAAIMLEAISGKDPRDSTSADRAVPKFSQSFSGSIKGMKVGLPKEYFVDGIEPEVRKAVENAVQILKSEGAQLIDIELPHTEYGIAVYYIVAPCEASSNLARYDGIRFGHRSKDSKDIREVFRRSRGEGFGPEPKRRIMLGTFALSSGYYDAYYKKACQVRRLIRDDFVKAFSKCDVIASPVTTGPAFKIGEKSSDPLKMYLNDVFTLAAPLAGIPGLSVNCGFTSSHLPIGLQLMAPHFEEERIFKAAYVVEKALSLKRRPDGI